MLVLLYCFYTVYQNLYLEARPNNSSGSSRTFNELNSSPIAQTIAHQLVKIANNNRQDQYNWDKRSVLQKPNPFDYIVSNSGQTNRTKPKD